MTDTLICILLLVNIGLFAYLALTARRLKSGIEFLAESNYANELLDEYEKQEIIKQREFDTRIRLLKEELAIANSKDKESRHGEPAQELHPLVKNLPHNSIRMSEPPDVEYAE